MSHLVPKGRQEAIGLVHAAPSGLHTSGWLSIHGSTRLHPWLQHDVLSGLK